MVYQPVIDSDWDGGRSVAIVSFLGSRSQFHVARHRSICALVCPASSQAQPSGFANRTAVAASAEGDNGSPFLHTRRIDVAGTHQALSCEDRA